MSLSNLSSQLAALNSAGAGAGIAAASSSRKHEDSVGRGLYHSAKHGHAIVHQNSVRHKPSVIHPDARSAAKADIPLVTLRDNATASLEFIHLSTHSRLFDMSLHETHMMSKKAPTMTPNNINVKFLWLDLIGAQSVKYERGLKTQEENKQLGLKLHQGFVLLSTVLGEEVAYLQKATSASHVTAKTTELNLVSAVLHVLEYLIQLYLPHVYNAESLIHAFLPHHETFVFQRIIQLIDLAPLPQWTFLRPYTTGSTLISRSLIAKWTASVKDNGSGNGILFRQVCDLAKNVAQVHALEEHLQPPSKSNNAVMQNIRPGISFVISFAAALLVEAVVMQAKELGTLHEMSVRVLLPFILEALGPSKDPTTKKEKKRNKSLGSICNDWRGFGYIMAVALNEYCELEASVLEVITTTAVFGLLETQLGEQSSSERNEVDSSAALLVFLMRILKSFRSKTPMKLSDYLPKISMTGPSVIEADVDTGMTCYNIPPSTLHAIIKLKDLSDNLSFLFTEKEIHVKPFIASIVGACVLSISINECTLVEGINPKLDLVLSLVREKPLEPVWTGKTESLTAAVTVLHITLFSSIDHDRRNYIEDFSSIKVILGHLQAIDPIGFDLGISYSLSSNSMVKYNLERKRLQLLLQSLGINNQWNEKFIPDEVRIGANSDVLFDNMRPMSLSISNSDPNQRLDAIDRLLLIHPTVSNNSNQAQDQVGDDSGAFVLNALLSLFVEDDQLRVATKAAEKILELVSISPYMWLVRNSYILDNIRKGLYKMSFFSHEHRISTLENMNHLSIEKKINNSSIDALLISLRLAASVIQFQFVGTRDYDKNIEGDDVCTPCHPQVYSILKIIFAHMLLRHSKVVDSENSLQSIQNTACSALSHVLGYSEINGEHATIFDTFISSPLFHHLLDKMILDGVTIEDKELVSTYVRYLSTQKTSTRESKIPWEISINAVIKVLDSYDDIGVSLYIALDDAPHYVSFFSSCTKKLIVHAKIPTVVDIVAQLCALKNDQIYELVSSDALNEICKIVNASFSHDSFILLALEAVAHPCMTTRSTIRLLTMLVKVVSQTIRKSTDNRMTTLLFTYVLSMMAHSERKVRELSIELLVQGKAAICPKRDNGPTLTVFFDLACLPTMRTQFLMDGSSSVVTLLRYSMKDADTVPHIREVIVRGCNLVVSSSFDCSITLMSTLNRGACYACSTIIRALHEAGEKYFPLSQIWTGAGGPIFFRILQFDAAVPLPSYVKSLLDTILVLLKGVTVRNDGENIVITTIPTGFSHRSRSYSMTGAPDDLCLIDHYPPEMVDAIFAGLNTLEPLNLDICTRLCELVLGSVSWGSLIFPKLDKSQRAKLCSQLLCLKIRYNIDIAGSVLVNFPLSGINLFDLLQSITLSEASTNEDLVSIVFIADCIRSKSLSICNDHHIYPIMNTLFEYLARLSDHSIASKSLDGLDYTISAILQALLTILDSVRNQSTSFSAMSKHSALLTALIGSDPSCLTGHIISGRGKGLAMKLLALICTADPPSILSTLLPSFIRRLKELKPHYVTSSSMIYQYDVLSVIIPAYVGHVDSSFFDLIRTIIFYCTIDNAVSWNMVLSLFQAINDSLLINDYSQYGSYLASIISGLFAAWVFYTDKRNIEDFDIFSRANDILNRSDNKRRLLAFIYIIQYAREISSCSYDKFSDMSFGDSNISVTRTSIELYLLARKGAAKEKQQISGIEMSASTAERLIEFLIKAVRENMLSINWRSFLQSNDGLEADVSLKLWREIFTLHSLCSRHKRTFIVTESLSDCLNSVQKQLPVPHFLATVVAMAHDNDADQCVRKKVIEMLADRCTEVDPHSSEATLFVETITELVDLLESDKDTLLIQAVLVCIERIARTCEYHPLVDERAHSRRLNTLTEALIQISRLLNTASLESEFEFRVQLFSSAVLCASTLIGVVKTRCLPFLPQLVKPFLTSLTIANKLHQSLTNGIVSNVSIESIQYMQISILRAIQSVGVNVPQSFGVYLDDLLSHECLSSVALRQSSVASYALVLDALKDFEKSLASCIPARQLIPSLCSAVSRGLKSHQDDESSMTAGLANIHLLTLVVSSSSRSDLVPLSGKIVHVLVEAYEHDDYEDARYRILSTASEAMLALIMKLSEGQLRPLYIKLREWKGGVENVDRKACLRRQAFWHLSSKLSIELRSIFLPYMSSVLNDAVNELENAASFLCSTPKVSREEKRRKIFNDDKDDFFRFSSVQPILYTLEHALKADAQDHNNWIVADEGRMYHMLLKPLGKLLSAIVPDVFPVQSSLSLHDATSLTKFGSFVCGSGTESYGSVLGCLTALALAGGNEVLWKPMNHAILEACSNESRSEVRKAGIRSLLSIIQSLGEEYMVLLPECLPVLSELLEDQDGEIVDMAKECIRRGEELLGESLL